MADTNVVEESQPVASTEETFAEQTPEQGETEPKGDIFDELLSSGVDTAFEPSVSEKKPGVSVEEAMTGLAPKADQEQFQYWQSQYDKVKSELDSKNDKYQELENIAPIAEYIKKNPQVLDAMENVLSNGVPQGQPMQQPQAQQRPPAQPLKQPARPTKPTDYDETEAYSDPDSNSFKYQRGLDKWRDEMIAFNEIRNINYGKAMQERARQAKAAQQEQAAQQAMGNVYTQLKQSYSFSDEQAKDFMATMSNPESISIDNLVALYKMRQAPSGEALKNMETAEKMQRQKDRLNIPRPVSTATAESPKEAPMEERIMDTLIDDFNAKNPF